MTTNQKNDTRSRKLEQAQSGTARAALLGISDGLVTNVSLILGVAAAGTSAPIVRLAGLASLIAGAFSMAVGEYISMRGQAELLKSVIDEEHKELKLHPDALHKELSQMLVADGVSSNTAAKAATEISADTEKALSMFSRVKLGLNPDELGAAWGSAASSFCMFSLGAFIPLAPWFFPTSSLTPAVSLGLSVIGALAIGAYLGINTSGRWFMSAMRQLLVLALAAGATYLVGRLFHVSSL